MFLTLNRKKIPDISSSTNSHAERKNVRTKALALAAKAQAAGAADVVNIV